MEQLASGKAARDEMRMSVEEHGSDSPKAKDAAEKIGGIATSRAFLVAQIIEDAKSSLTKAQVQKIEDGRSEICNWIEGLLSAKKL